LKEASNGGPLKPGRAERLPFLDEAFDVVVSTSTFHYLRRPGKALREIARVLKPGGEIVITDWCHDYLACHVYDLAKIAGARFVELPGDAHFFWIGDLGPILDEVERFVSVTRDAERAFDRVLTTVLFTDIVDSTAQTVALGDSQWREIQSNHDKVVKTQLSRFRGKHVRSTGDGVLATFDGPARAVYCATAIVESIKSLGIEIRAGIHTGEVELHDNDIAGIAVAIGARIGALAGPSEVLVSQTIRDLVAGSGLAFEDAGEQVLKGVPEPWKVYRVAEA